jgi:hypothetical protein
MVLWDQKNVIILSSCHPGVRVPAAIALPISSRRRSRSSFLASRNLRASSNATGNTVSSLIDPRDTAITKPIHTYIYLPYDWYGYDAHV